jgi:uncharacterized RDD family membrane protein YckC
LQSRKQARDNRPDMRQELTILTPEKVELTFRLAGIPSRAWAFILDQLLLWGVLLVLLLLGALVLNAVEAPDELCEIATVVWAYFSFAAFFVYPMLFHIFMHGQTPGKLVLGLRVIMLDGSAVTAQAAILRTLAVAADFAPSLFLAGAIAMLLSAKSQRIGDMVAGTIVIGTKRPRRPAPAAEPGLAAGAHGLEAHVGSVRRLNEADLRAIRAFLGRYAELDPASRDRLYLGIWSSLTARVELDMPAGASPLDMLAAVASKLERDLATREA